MRRTRATTSCEVKPEGLSMMRTAFMGIESLNHFAI
jgi:hypothetical protein